MAQQSSRPPPQIAPVTGWQVEDQRETVEVGPDGKAAQGMRIEFVTGKGVRASVFIPRARYNIDNVRAAVASAAAEIDQIHGLSG